jgi:DNA-binding GntR family transcriptional regulator
LDTRIHGGAGSTPHFGTAQEHAYAYLRERILSGQYAGGTRVDVNEIAAAVGASRMPVREALRQLDAEGLVTIRPNRGAVVTALTPDDVLDVFEMRAALEALAVRVALPRLDENALADLAQIADRMDRSRGHGAAWLRHHDDFHAAICAMSGRARLIEQTARLRRHVEPYLRVHVGVYDPPEMLGSEHRELLAALRAGDPARAEAAMREHVERGGAHVVDVLKKGLE